MLKSHQYLLEPRPSDRMRIGDRIVDIPLREIAPMAGAEAVKVRVTLKSLGVLMVLVAHAGRPVSREALLEWVWPDTLPTDDVVTQAIAQLRRALGDDRERPRYIETLAKQGYRLIAPVEWIVEEATSAPAPGLGASATATSSAASPAASVATPAPPSSMDRWRWPLAAGVVAFAVVVGVFAFGQRQEQRSRAAAAAVPVSPPSPSGAPLSFQRIASLPVAEERPSLSPDGALVVYTRSVSGEGAPLMLQTSSAMTPRALTPTVPDQYDMMPAWSPDGRQIAFVRSSRGRCLVMAIPAAGGDARELGECLGGGPHPLAWYPDGEALVGAHRPGQVVADGAEKALYRMALDSGRWARIAYARSATDEDISPTVSPDGRWIAFQRNLSLADLWLVPATGGTPRRVTHLRTNIHGLAWAPDSRHLIFSRFVDGRIALSTVDVRTQRIVDHYASQGGFMFPSVALRAGAIAFEVGDTRSITRRVALDDGDAAIARSSTLFESTGSNLLPAVSPDGDQVLFVSDRTGDVRLWWLDQTRPDSLRAFEGFVPMPRHPAMWHPDGQRALVIGRDAAGRFGVFEAEPRRGRLSRLPVPGAEPVHVAWHPDPDRLLVVADQGEGRLGATLYDRSRTPWRALARVPDVAVAVVDPRHRRIVMASMSTPEIRSADLDLGQVRSVDRVQVLRRNRSLVATEDGVRVMDMSGMGIRDTGKRDCFWHWRPVAVAPGDGNADAGGRCLGDARWLLEGVSHSPRDRSLYLSTVEDMQSDIGVAPLSVLPELAAAPPGGQLATH